VAYLSEDTDQTFTADISNHVFEEWVPGKRIRGVYLGAYVFRRMEFMAVSASNGTIQTFTTTSRPYRNEPESLLERVPVGALVSIECLALDHFHVESKPWKALKSLQ